MMISMFHGYNTCPPMIQEANPSVFFQPKILQKHIISHADRRIGGVRVLHVPAIAHAPISCYTPCQALVDCQSQYTGSRVPDS